jgi:hypothetical protein
VDSKLASFPFGTNYNTAITDLDGRRALTCVTHTNSLMGVTPKWFFSAAFFWESNSVWQKSTLCTVNMTADRLQTFSALTNSLKSLRVQQHPRLQ